MTAKPILRKVDERILQQLTAACHILYVQGHNDVNHGQISARVADEEKYWIRGASLGFDEVEHHSFTQIRIDGNIVQGHASVPPEWPIHSEIYEARPDVNAVVHTHAPASIIFGALEEALLPLSHDGCPFSGKLGVFSETTNTILTREMAKKMVLTLATNSAVLLKNHGVVVVGGSIKEATILALMLENACAMQLRVPVGKNVSPSPPFDVVEKNHFIFSDLAVSTYWSYYLRKVNRIQSGVQLPESTEAS